MRRDKIAKDTMRELKVGDKVTFENKSGKLITGTIRKKNIKRLVVDTPEGLSTMGDFLSTSHLWCDKVQGDVANARVRRCPVSPWGLAQQQGAAAGRIALYLVFSDAPGDAPGLPRA